MSIIPPPSEGTPRELIPAGNYIARCYKMLEIGLIKETIQGEEKIQHKVRIGWELPTETRVFQKEKGPQPLVIDKKYTLSLADKANLRRDLKSWRGQDFTEEQIKTFDITNLLGVPCMLNIIHRASKTGKVYEEISGITPMPKGVECPAQVNPSIELSYDKWNEDLFNSLPGFIKDEIRSSEQYIMMTTPDAKEFLPEGGIEDSPLPF